jgi:hypothetical protein
MSSILRPGDRIHVTLRRLFDEEPRRHFSGVVQAATDSLAKIDGWPWLFDSSRNVFIRSDERRVRLVSLVDASNVIHVLPADVDPEKLKYEVLQGGRYAITDGGSFRMDVNEFGPRR